jgi:tellurite resistance protein TehA-like permease
VNLAIALIIWGWGVVWVFISFSGLAIKLSRGRIPFNLGWWAFTFPLGHLPPDIYMLIAGCFGLATGLLGRSFDDHFFKVVATVVAIIVLLFWLLVSFKTIQHTLDGRLFFPAAPNQLKTSPSPTEQSDTDKSHLNGGMNNNGEA